MTDPSYHYDVLIVGAGNAACCAAHAALEKGAKVGILEKAHKRHRGGNSALTGHMRFVFNGLEDIRPLVRGMSDDELRALLERMPKRTEDMLWDEVMRVTDNQSDQDMLQVHVTESLPTVQWLAAKGHDWVPAGGFNMPRQHPAHERRRYGLQQRNFAILERDGAAFHYGTAATELIQDDKGHVIGVRALTPEGFATSTQIGRARVRKLRSEPGDACALPRAGLGHDPYPRRAVQHGRRAAHGARHRRDAAWELDHVSRLAAGHRDAAVHDSRRVHDQALMPATCIRTPSWST